MRSRPVLGQLGRAVTWLLALAASVLVAAVVGLLVLGRLPHGYERSAVVAVLVGAAVAVATAEPLRGRVVRLVRRKPDRSPEETLRMLGERASRGVAMEELLLQVAESLRAVLSASSVEVWTGDGTRLDRLLRLPRSVPGSMLGASHLGAGHLGAGHLGASHLGAGHLDAEALRLLGRTSIAGDGWLNLWLPELLVGHESESVRAVPALHGGTVLGLLVVARRDGDGPVTESEERTLVEVGRRLGLLLHNRELDSALHATLEDLRRTNEDLRASRARLAAASDDVRRRIERDLHDGAQQHLVAMAVNLSLASGLIESDPAAARELVDQTRHDAHQAVGELRDLAHGIYPSLLIEAGLGQALRSLSLRSSSGFTIDAGGVTRCAAAVEAAVYFCCLEALQNAAKHAPGAAVDVTLRAIGTSLRVDVVDDGPGLPDGGVHRPVATLDGVARGQGVQNMIDRLGAVGGRVTWTTAPGGGTQVRLDVPDAGLVASEV